MTATATPPPAQARKIRLHAAQQAFLRSNALFRAFCGGIGSGKSWAGSYDLIRKAKSGRLYLVMAPTYSMLSDATFRMFLALAESLGIVDAGDVRRSAPPSIKLRTGAEVLFRSADEPDRLRGPNLSGVWMDEASLMHLDAFTIAIGRLREAGEQGWLSATFTPKGKTHWTHETFATGRPDTALFHARTADNPFLPSNFHGTIRKQYTTALAAQELEGLFTDAAGTIFRRQWFGIVDEVPELRYKVRAWDLAATPKDERKSHDPDFSVGLLMGRADDGTNYVLNVRRIQGSAQQVQVLVRRTAEADGQEVPIVMEQEPGSSGVAVIDHYLRHVLAGFDFHGERSTGSKADRAQPLAAQAEGGTVKLLAGPWVKDFLDEIETFPFASHDDQVDAASAAFNHLAINAGNWDFGPDNEDARPDSIIARLPRELRDPDLPEGGWEHFQM